MRKPPPPAPMNLPPKAPFFRPRSYHSSMRGIAHAAGNVLLVFPVLVQIAPNSGGRGRPPRLPCGPQAEFLDEVQIVEHFGVGLLAANLLVFENLAGAAMKPVKNSSRLSSRLKSVSGDPQGTGLDLVAGVESKTGDAAVGGNVLVLLADRFVQPVDLDVAGLAANCAG